MSHPFVGPIRYILIIKSIHFLFVTNVYRLGCALLIFFLIITLIGTLRYIFQSLFRDCPFFLSNSIHPFFYLFRYILIIESIDFIFLTSVHRLGSLYCSSDHYSRRNFAVQNFSEPVERLSHPFFGPIRYIVILKTADFVVNVYRLGLLYCSYDHYSLPRFAAI